MPTQEAMRIAILQHILDNVPLPNVGDAAGLPGSVTPGFGYLSLHVGDPGTGNDQTQNEVAYTGPSGGYARWQAVRTPTADALWLYGTVGAAGRAQNTLEILFPESNQVVVGQVTHIGYGFAASGVGDLKYSEALDSPLTIGVGTIPRLVIGAAAFEQV